jgi:hypothetical protein
MGAGEKLLILIFLSVCGAFAVDENNPTNARLQFRPLGGGLRARNNFTSQVKSITLCCFVNVYAFSMFNVLNSS